MFLHGTLVWPIESCTLSHHSVTTEHEVVWPMGHLKYPAIFQVSSWERVNAIIYKSAGPFVHIIQC